MRLRSIAALLALAGVASAQKYTGPRPPKPDLPYLKHAETLVPTEASEAKEEKGKKDDITYAIAGASSSAKTPLASPILLMESQKLSADKLELYKLEVKSGHREITVSPKKPAKRRRINISASAIMRSINSLTVGTSRIKPTTLPQHPRSYCRQ